MKKLLTFGVLINSLIGFSQAQKTTENRIDNSNNIAIEEPSIDKNIEVEENSDAIYSSAGIEIQPEYVGGNTKFYTDFNKNFKLKVENEDIRGRIFVEFIVEKNGTLSDIKIIRDLLNFSVGKKIIEALTKMPKWKPGKQNEKTIRVRYALPIIIDIKQNTDINTYYPPQPNKNIEIKELKSK